MVDCFPLERTPQKISFLLIHANPLQVTRTFVIYGSFSYSDERVQLLKSTSNIDFGDANINIHSTNRQPSQKQTYGRARATEAEKAAGAPAPRRRCRTGSLLFPLTRRAKASLTSNNCFSLYTARLVAPRLGARGHNDLRTEADSSKEHDPKSLMRNRTAQDGALKETSRPEPPAHNAL
ncbi:hypothetical protein EVAR_91444_1 [Eumeta japonica]|uniref:Uncharacterized protein n=1 Tax=Eumeta variegata TaxID=151549 RepID=A0A4C1X1G6_EUMVA|nr:hypothetical protein EVAR_91444_1 [Eumeta japonica]